MTDVDTLLTKSLLMIEQALDHLQQLSIAERLEKHNIDILIKLTHSLLTLKKAGNNEGSSASQLTDEELELALAKHGAPTERLKLPKKEVAL